MKNELTADDIRDVEVLRTGTVYKLLGWSLDTLVVKSQAGNVTEESFQVTKKSMKLVDPMAGAAKLLTDNEKRALKWFAQQHVNLAGGLTEHRMAAYAITGGATVWANEIISNIDGTLWYKMPVQNVSDMGDALDKRMQATPDKGLLREFQEALWATGGLESLGMIVACDLFVGNNDRFNPTGGSNRTYGATTLNFKVVKNVTNIFIGGPSTGRWFTGMDFLDPNAGFRWFNQTIAQIKMMYDQDWPGQYLVDKEKRQKFCKDIIWDLNLILSGGASVAKQGLLAPKKTWTGDKAKDRLETGMIAGGQQIRDGLTSKYGNDPNRPAGLDSRLAALAKL